ncbi:MAG: hypothetical protein MUF00_15715 [Gemmatimonadaceae bacterium]|jgi:hypothetical protein|nr:hypothetical protein [Gemmatimonadaceae bacterium]
MHRLLAVTVAAVVTSSAVQAQLPSVQQVYDRYATAVGGRAAWEKISARSDKGTVDISFAGISGAYERHVAKERMRMIMDLGMGKVDQGFDGTIGWASQPMGGAQKMPAEQIAETKESTQMGASQFDVSRFSKATVDGKEMFEGADCYKLTVTSKTGQERTEFFDVATGLRRGVRVKTPAGEQQQTFDDYKEVAGVKVAMKQRIGTPQGDIIITLTSVTFGAQDAATYEAPAEVKALP